MRIISGDYKGRRITAPKKLPVRPTTDMAKESLFNILNNLFLFGSISVLDLFSGTGNISYEFASRGVKNIVCVDKNYHCIKFINTTAHDFNMPLITVRGDVFNYLLNTKKKYDVIFADPPYDFDVDTFSKIPNIVFKNNLLEQDGLLIVEHSKHTNLSHLNHFLYSRIYGGNMFSFFKNKED